MHKHIGHVAGRNPRKRKRLTPIVSISKETFVFERPEVNLLLELSGIYNASEKLMFIDDLTDLLENKKSEVMQSRKITLVDQNTLNKPLGKFKDDLVVVEIVDHHKDSGEFLMTCSGKSRVIAFGHSRSLVASACTLIAEKLISLAFPTPHAASIGILLLGVILIDSVNLDESIGKVTQRDRDAVKSLISDTKWDEDKPLSSSHIFSKREPEYGDSSEDVLIDTNAFFDTLQHAKYEPFFWNEFSVKRALRYDFKDFVLRWGSNVGSAYGSNLDSAMFGISTVLMPGLAFLEKERFVEETLAFLESEELHFLSIMFAFYDAENCFQRQLAFCAVDNELLDKVVDTLLSSADCLLLDLQLKEILVPFQIRGKKMLNVRLFHQRNPVPSRKQIGPMLEQIIEM